MAGSILKMENENYAPCGQPGHESDCVCTKSQRPLYCHAISAKRYALYTLENGEPVIQKYSEHGLGHLLDPTDTELHKDEPPNRPEDEEGADPALESVTTSGAKKWTHLLWEGIVKEALELPWTAPDWLSLPAVSPFTVSKPPLADRFKGYQSYGKETDYAQQIKPFNFILVAHDDSLGAKTVPVAPYEKDPLKWLKQPWVDERSGCRRT